MKQFASIEKLDTGILYTLELASSLFVLLLAFGLIAGQVSSGQQLSLVTLLSFWPLVLARLLASGQPKKEPNASGAHRSWRWHGLPIMQCACIHPCRYDRDGRFRPFMHGATRVARQ